MKGTSQRLQHLQGKPVHPCPNKSLLLTRRQRGHLGVLSSQSLYYVQARHLIPAGN